MTKPLILLQEDPTLSKRVKFLIMDLLDLHKNGWKVPKLHTRPDPHPSSSAPHPVPQLGVSSSPALMASTETGISTGSQSPSGCSVLQNTENSWATNPKKALADERAKVKLQVRGMLNKLTFENFDKLYQELVEMPDICTPDHLK